MGANQLYAVSVFLCGVPNCLYAVRVLNPVTAKKVVPCYSSPPSSFFKGIRSLKSPNEMVCSFENYV